MKSRRIVIFAGGGIEHTSGGVGTLILNLLDCWGGQPGGHEVEVIDTRGAGGVGSGVAHFTRALWRLGWLAGTSRLALVHVHMTTRGSAVRKCCLVLLGRSFGVPAITHLHGADFQEFFVRVPAPFRRAIRLALNSSRHVIVLGEGWREFLIDEVGVSAKKIRVVYNGVPARVGFPDVARDPGQPVKILFLGRLGDRKGVPDLLAALGSQSLMARHWTATLAGDGEIERFRAEVAQAGLSTRVTLPGWTDRATTEAMLREADIFVLPSRHEALPMAIVEALAHAVPVIATPVGVTPELLRDGETARLVPAGNSGALANAIAALIDQPDERRRLGAAGHRVFLENLEIGGIADQIRSMYDTAIASRVGSMRRRPEMAEHV
jgi:glycosyltransferase involved in cell wall biosynthesis